MNPLNGASTSQPAPDDTFADHRRRPPPLPSPTYDGHPPPLPPEYYGCYAPSPRQEGGWPAPPGPGGGVPSPAPQFTCRSGSGAASSAFGRYEGTTTASRSSSIQSLGSSVDAYYARRDSGASSSGASAAAAASVAMAGPPGARQRSSAASGTSQDFSKIAELIRDSSERTRSNSLDECGRAGREGYDDVIPRSRSMPSGESGRDCDRGDTGEEEVPSEPPAAAAASSRGKPSLIRKLSGGSIPPRHGPLRRPPVANRPDCGSGGGICRPEPVKRDTSNQPETLETKRAIKRVVLSRDQSAVSRQLKEEQKTRGGERRSDPVAMSRLKRAELLDRKLSVEMNKLGVDDAEYDDDAAARPPLERATTRNILGRMTTEDVLGRQPLERMTTEDVLGAFIDSGEDDCDRPPELGRPAPPAIGSAAGASPLGEDGGGDGDRAATIDAIALEIANGRHGPAGADDWDDALDLEPELGPAAPMVHGGEMGGGVNADVAEKWLKGET